MIGIGEYLARTALGAVAHLSWWVAWQTRANPSDGCVDAQRAIDEAEG
jgi:hypothetical protein